MIKSLLGIRSFLFTYVVLNVVFLSFSPLYLRQVLKKARRSFRTFRAYDPSTGQKDLILYKIFTDRPRKKFFYNDLLRDNN